MNSIGQTDVDFSRMSAAEYRKLADGCNHWDPDPFASHPDGAWHERVFPDVVTGVADLLSRLDAGYVDEHQLLQGKDNDGRAGPNGLPRCQDTLSYWLYFQHHPGHERWKLLGQIYWSVDAFLSWRSQYFGVAPEARLHHSDRLPHLITFPKKALNGLRSEHVVPKREMKKLLLPTRDREAIASLLRLNLCCVVTRAEDRRLPPHTHPNPTEPWLRYRGKGIVLLHNPAWTDLEIEGLLRNGLLSLRSVSPFA